MADTFVLARSTTCVQPAAKKKPPCSHCGKTITGRPRHLHNKRICGRCELRHYQHLSPLLPSTVALLQLLFLALWLARRLIPACRRHHRSTCHPHLKMSLTQPAQYARQQPWRPLMTSRAAVHSWEPHWLWPTWLSWPMNRFLRHHHRCCICHHNNSTPTSAAQQVIRRACSQLVVQLYRWHCVLPCIWWVTSQRRCHPSHCARAG